ncbi:MAG: hypothetical protein VZR95_04185 [Alphaproteobacteria bacterium]
MNIAEIRQKYPQYDNISDEQLARGLHKKYYPTLDFDDFAQRIGYQAQNPVLKMTPEQKEQAAKAAKEWREQVKPTTAGDKVAEFMVTNPYARQAGFALQGISNAGLNPAGYIARAAGMDTKPLEARNAAERITELAGQYGYDAAAIATSLGGAAEAGIGGTGLTGNVIKAMAEGGMPLAETGALGSAFMTGTVNPKGQWGRFLTDMGGGMATAPIYSLGSKAAQSIAPVKQIIKSKYQLNQLTNDPDSGIFINTLKKVSGKGKTIDDVLNQENQRLSRQAQRAEKIFDARRNSQENQTSGYVYDTDGLYGRVPAGPEGNRFGNEAQQSIKRLRPNEKLSETLENPLTFNEYAPNVENGKRFSQAMSDFKKSAGYTGEQVWQYTPEEYAKMRTFLTDDGKVGFAIKDDGDVVSVFSNNGPRGAADSIMQAATSVGGKKLDAYDTFLPEIYSRHGFKVTSRDPWNNEFASKTWDKAKMRNFNLGEPDVVYMQYDPNYYGGYEAPNSLQNVVNRLQKAVDNGKSKLQNIWQPEKSAVASRNEVGVNEKRSFVEALADETKRRKMRNAVLAGADDLSERAQILSDALEHRKNGWHNTSLENLIKTPELAAAEKNYGAFMAKNGNKKLSAEKVNDFYEQHPVAQNMIDEMRELDPRAFDGVERGSLKEFDMLKQALRYDAGKNITVGASKKKAFKRAEDDLKTLMDDEFAGFREVNKEYATAETTQDIFESRLSKGLTSVGGSTAVTSPFWSGFTSPAVAAGLTAGYFNPTAAVVTAGALGGKAAMRSARRNLGREIANGVTAQQKLLDKARKYGNISLRSFLTELQNQNENEKKQRKAMAQYLMSEQ